MNATNIGWLQLQVLELVLDAEAEHALIESVRPVTVIGD